MNDVSVAEAGRQGARNAWIAIVKACGRDHILHLPAKWALDDIRAQHGEPPGEWAHGFLLEWTQIQIREFGWNYAMTAASTASKALLKETLSKALAAAT